MRTMNRLLAPALAVSLLTTAAACSGSDARPDHKTAPRPETQAPACGTVYHNIYVGNVAVKFTPPAGEIPDQAAASATIDAAAQSALDFQKTQPKGTPVEYSGAAVLVMTDEDLGAVYQFPIEDRALSAQSSILESVESGVMQAATAAGVPGGIYLAGGYGGPEQYQLSPLTTGNGIVHIILNAAVPCAPSAAVSM